MDTNSAVSGGIWRDRADTEKNHERCGARWRGTERGEDEKHNTHTHGDIRPKTKRHTHMTDFGKRALAGWRVVKNTESWL